jgi:hypothetical protein
MTHRPDRARRIGSILTTISAKHLVIAEDHAVLVEAERV